MQERIKILSDSEIQEIYGFPIFTDEDRKTYFSLSDNEKRELNTLSNFGTKIYFNLQLGYFKAKQLFFNHDNYDTKTDITFILKNSFCIDTKTSDIEIPKVNKKRCHDKILHLFDYNLCDEKIKRELNQKANQTATIYSNPIYIFNQILTYLESNRIVLPGYSTLQDIVSKSITFEKKRTESLIKEIPDEIKSDLKALLSNNSLYEVTLLRKDPKDFNYTQMKTEIKKQKSIDKIYNFTKDFLPKLNISNENIKYYSSLVEYYTVYKLNRMSVDTSNLYLLCFVYNRFQKINDNLVDAFISLTNKYISESKEVTEERITKLKMENYKNMKGAGHIIGFFIDTEIPNTKEFGEVREKAFKIVNKDDISLLSKYFLNPQIDEDEYKWDYYDEIARKITTNLRPLFLSIDFESNIKDNPLINAVNIIKPIFQKNKNLSGVNCIPEDIIPIKIKKYIYNSKKLQEGKITKNKEININKYEFLLYKLLKEGFDSGNIFFTESISHKSFEDDVISLKKWENKDELIKQSGILLLQNSVETIISKLKEELDSKIYKVNKRIKEGKNESIEIIGDIKNRNWSLPYQKIEELVNHSFYKKIPGIDITNIIHFVNEQCNFISSFDHLVNRYTKKDIDTPTIAACLLAYGTNMGIIEMSDVSDIDYQSMFTSTITHIRPETLRKASDVISNAITKLPAFEYYNIDDEIHSSSDGQKFETKFNTVKSRYSPKYFGLNKGIVSYTLVANHIPVNAKIIGANEHESHYVFDILFNNTSDIQPKIHSTDNHGINQINFALLYSFGYKFAPRYKDFKNRAKDNLYCMKSLEQYDNYFLKPIRKINSKIIIDEWDNIQRILVSLALKETTQSIIIKKLSSYKRRNKTRKALWEFDNIIKSIHILDYIDDLFFRRNIQKAVNRGEAYHGLKKAIRFAHGGGFKVRTELEQQIWDESSRLIANCVIFFNCFLLSKVIASNQESGNNEEVNQLKNISPMAWRHIHFYGRYNFQKKENVLNVSEIINTLSNQKLIVT